MSVFLLNRAKASLAFVAESGSRPKAEQIIWNTFSSPCGLETSAKSQIISLGIKTNYFCWLHTTNFQQRMPREMHLLVFSKFLTPWEVQMRKMLSESKPLPSQIPSELWLVRYNLVVQRPLVLREGLHNTKELNFIWFCYKEALLTATLQSALWVIKSCGLMISTESTKVFNNQRFTLRGEGEEETRSYAH